MGRITRRDLLRLATLGASSAVVCDVLGGVAFAVDPLSPGARRDGRRSLVVLWLAGGPSQLETFDPKPGTPIGGPTRAIRTALAGVVVAEGYPGLAERLGQVALVRSLVTGEGEHARGTYLMRTGHVMNPTVEHPSLGAVCAHELDAPRLEIPRHVSILSRRPPRGGFLGAELNAFSLGDPREPLQDLVSPVGEARLGRRLELLDALEAGFAAGRGDRVAATQHGALARAALDMMSSEQVRAFSCAEESEGVKAAYGDTPFGRGCLVARRLVEAGVPAVEVTLDGWDTHVDNFEGHAALAGPLDRALSALLDDLRARDLLASTLVLCLGEFGRTPRVNGLEGRDHWTRGFSAVLAGCGLRSGVVLGETDPAGEAPPRDPVSTADLFATIYEALGVERGKWFATPQGRPIQLNDGTPLRALRG